MTVIQLECFIEVCKQHNFSKAAANLYLSQPTLSRHIQALEEELRASLFIRSSNSTQLTAIGQSLYPTLQRLYQNFRDASSEMQEIVDRHTGLFRIGLVAGLQLHKKYQSAIRHLRSRYPNAKIRVCHVSMNQINPCLMSGSVDVLFALDAFVPPSDKVCSCQLFVENMYLAVPSDHPNAELEQIEQNRIREFFPDLELCLLDASDFEPQLQDTLMSSVKDCDNGQDILKIPASPNDMEDILLMVTAGLGATCINANCKIKYDPMVSMIPLVESTSDGFINKQISVGAYWLDKITAQYLKPLSAA